MARDVPTSRRAVLLAIFIAFGFLFGYDMGVISGCLIMPDFIRRFGQEETDGQYYLSSSRQSIIVSLLSAGTFCGAIAQAFTSDRLGRRGSILFWSAIFTVGVAVQTGTTYSLVQLVIGRYIAGLGVGSLSAIVPLYNGETAPKAIRGTILVIYQVQIISGIFLSYVFQLGSHTINNSASWRLPIGLQMVWGIILLSGMFFLPESPRHLLGTGRGDEARKVVAELNGVPEDDPLVAEVVEELDFAIKAENEGGKATWLECFSTRNALWRRTMNGMMLQFIQQLNGQNFYYYYGDTFFQNAGAGLSPYIIQTVLGAVSVFGTLPALYFIETWGRRKSLLLGACAQAVCALIVAVVGHTTLAPTGTPISALTARNRAGGDVVIAFAIFQVFIFGTTWGPTPWVYLGESFPLRVRPKSIALGSATNWFWNFMLSFFSPRIVDRIGPLIMLVFFGMLVFGYIYVYFAIPETKGLTLEEVDELYRSGIAPWRSVGWRPSEKHYHHEVHDKQVSDCGRNPKDLYAL
ncbi:general substrate transporter [Suillus bovinus]|uniref:general substrate transporter n=1 Tax=Suillus bovinus TaxID=48563 RepID=UPI001B86D40F|nr:general substrate transporter [Suillus bovinus]XP_041309371.1 general substrate transporter [Suillus bovinus]KAG2136543.1 general substrate transporter [Suillus bovinus]KAG2153516.1 general substrate transporter [Suillus bovinus]